jgi:hypothetical protein
VTNYQCPALSGDDNEDGTLGQGSSFKITSLPPGGTTLRYNGSPVTVNQVITNYDSTLLTMDVPYETRTLWIWSWNLPYSGSYPFNYVSIDEAGEEDLTPNVATLGISRFVISGTVYNDGDGGTPPNGTGIDDIDGSPMYAYLVNSSGNVEEASEVQSDGSYELKAGDQSINYTVRISTSMVSVGDPAPSTALPADWVYTDEVYGSNNTNGSGSDGNANFQVAAQPTTLVGMMIQIDITGLNFGINQRPSTNDAFASYPNPGRNNKSRCANPFRIR